jgi:long-chain acyl-CoA synthetase
MSATEKELRQWCRERIANYKVPASVRFMDDLPKGPTGKVLRRALKDLLAETA